MNSTLVGVDLAKDVIQVCVAKSNKVFTNKEITSSEFAIYLATSKPMKVVFEACGTSNYWKQVATKAGHEARLISAKLVANIRQHQKTDANDALAIIQASQLTDIKFINGKTFEQQELQSIMRMRELAVKHKVALSNQIGALLLEFNIRVSARSGGVNGVVPQVLEEAENGFSIHFRGALKILWKDFLSKVETIASYDKHLEKTVRNHPQCKRLLAIEGVGIINAANLYIALGCSEAGTFKKGRDAAAFVGLTPIQHSSGGTVKLGSIRQRVRDGGLRSCLVCGAMAVVRQVVHREPRTVKEAWLKQLIERRGKRCAAVALANKTVRTVFAMLHNGTEYKAQPLMG